MPARKLAALPFLRPRALALVVPAASAMVVLTIPMYYSVELGPQLGLPPAACVALCGLSAGGGLFAFDRLAKRMPMRAPACGAFVVMGVAFLATPLCPGPLALLLQLLAAACTFAPWALEEALRRSLAAGAHDAALTPWWGGVFAVVFGGTLLLDRVASLVATEVALGGLLLAAAPIVWWCCRGPAPPPEESVRPSGGPQVIVVAFLSGVSLSAVDGYLRLVLQHAGVDRTGTISTSLAVLPGLLPAFLPTSWKPLSRWLRLASAVTVGGAAGVWLALRAGDPAVVWKLVTVARVLVEVGTSMVTAIALSTPVAVRRSAFLAKQVGVAAGLLVGASAWRLGGVGAVCALPTLAAALAAVWPAQSWRRPPRGDGAGVVRS